MSKEVVSEIILKKSPRHGAISFGIGALPVGFLGARYAEKPLTEKWNAYQQSEACKDNALPSCKVEPYAALELAGAGALALTGAAVVWIFTSRVAANAMGMSNTTVVRRTPDAQPEPTIQAAEMPKAKMP